MPRLLTVALVALLTFLAGMAVADQKDSAPNYAKLPVQTKLLEAGKPEAVLFFWYGCNGCYQVAQEVAKKGADWPPEATLINMPALGHATWRFHGRIYLALEAMNVPPQTHLAVFDAIQNRRLRVMERGDLPALANLLGIDGISFMQAFDSAELEAKMDEINRASAAYNINQVPAMVVEGRYKFDLGMVDGPLGFVTQTEELLALSANK